MTSFSMSAEAVLSSRLVNFDMKQCRPDGVCFRLTGKIGYLSQSLNSIVAPDAKFELFKLNDNKPEVYLCLSLSYRMDSQIIQCKVSNNPKIDVLTIDSKLEIHTFAKLAKPIKL
jgi:hypothetical protein